MTSPFSWALALALLLTLTSPLAARDRGAPDPHLLTAGFLSAHPDLKHRMEGLDALDRGDHAAAFNAFKRAARYADKPSQAMIAELLWQGTGVEADRALAYAWMDLAAERAYVSFIARREAFWEQLSEDERSRAQREGIAVYDEYGDTVARDRLTRVLERERRKMTGSRLGSVGALTIRIPGPSGWITIGGDTYYADRYWEPEQYFAWQDETWKPAPTGTVEVGELATPASAAPRNTRD